MSAELLPTDVEDRQGALVVVWRHWRNEIVALAQGGAAAWGKPADAICLIVSPDAVAVTFESEGRIEELGQFPRTAAGAGALAARLAQKDLLKPGRTDVQLQFDDASTLRSRIKLPKASRAALRGALGFELDRLSPIPPAELYYDFAIAVHEKPANRVEIASRALRRRVVDDAARFARSAGLTVAGIRIGADAEPADWRHFPIDRGSLMRAFWKGWGSVLLAGIAVVLLLATLFAMAARTAARDGALDARIADAEIRAALVSRLEQKMTLLRGQAAFVAERKMQTSFVSTLASLTQLLPDDTWLTDIQFDGGKLHIQGYSHAASNLIAVLDRSGRFSNTQFNAPLVRNDTDGTERFDLTSKVTGAP